MNNFQILGTGLFSFGILLVLGFAFSEFITAVDIPFSVKAGLILIFLGLAVLLVSLIFERFKEEKK